MRYLVMAFLMLFASPAHAVTIKNLSGSTQVVVVEHGGASDEIVLEPGQSHHRFGAGIALMMPGQRPIRNVDPYDQYAIWPEGKLYIQKRQAIKGRGNF